MVVREAGATLASSAAAAMVRRVQFQFRPLVVFPCPRLQSPRFTDTQEAFRNKQTHKSRPRAPKTLQNFKTTKTSKTKQKHTKTEELQPTNTPSAIRRPSATSREVSLIHAATRDARMYTEIELHRRGIVRCFPSRACVSRWLSLPDQWHLESRRESL